MRRSGDRGIHISVFLAIVFLINSSSALSQSSKQSRPRRVTETGSVAGPTIWRDPGDVESLDFTYGPGGVENSPQPPFTFIEEDTDGSNAKIKVKDAAGRHWSVKWGSEVNAEVFAARIAWAAGYYVEPSYFVARGSIEGVTKVDRARKYIKSDGSFTDARFELKEEGFKRLKDKKSWRWNGSPFMGRKELSGLKIVMMLTSNWDSKDERDEDRGSNTSIFINEDTGEERYVITDWGGTMGKWGNYFTREKWDCKGYAGQNQEFITSAWKGKMEFGYKGQRTDDIRSGVRITDLQWLVRYIGRITDSQLKDGLRASGATEEEIACFTRAIRERLDQMKTIAEF